jgi:hypothetical protein
MEYFADFWSRWPVKVFIDLGPRYELSCDNWNHCGAAHWWECQQTMLACAKCREGLYRELFEKKS